MMGSKKLRYVGRKQNEIQAGKVQANISGENNKFSSGHINSRNVRGIQRRATKVIKGQEGLSCQERLIEQRAQP